MIWYIPLEILDERYTKLMDNQLQQYWRDKGTQYNTINGEQLTDKIESGAFLDAEGTNYFKASQLMRICKLFKDKKVQSGDKFFFSDLWYPGLEMIPYMAEIEDIDIEIWGIVHAGSFTETDIVAEMYEWAYHMEKGWFNIATGLFVGSKQIRDDLTKKNRAEPYKIHITGLPFDSKAVQTNKPVEREELIVFPFRFHYEKGAYQWLQMIESISLRRPQLQFLILGGNSQPDRPFIEEKYKDIKAKIGDRLQWKKGLSKQDYYNELARAKVVVSFALQENFGYGILEAVTLGAHPVLPNRCSYPEIYPNEYIYNTEEECYQKVFLFLDTPTDEDKMREITSNMNNSIERMMGHMK